MIKSLRRLLLTLLGIPGLLLLHMPLNSFAAPPFKAKDPGMRLGAPDAGTPLSDLTLSQLSFFEAGKVAFDSEEGVAQGLGPRMNLDSCVGCHLYPASGGASPFVNPQIAFAKKNGATNLVPSFLSLDGPVREVRFIKNPDGSTDGGVHGLFTISGRADAPGCVLSQPDFEGELAKNNLSFRIPTPIFGAGLIEQIPDSAILANQGLYAEQKKKLGIVGRANIVRFGRTPGKPISGTTNTNGNDGTISRFGCSWWGQIFTYDRRDASISSSALLRGPSFVIRSRSRFLSRLTVT